jgi:hypothetical protein
MTRVLIAVTIAAVIVAGCASDTGGDEVEQIPPATTETLPAAGSGPVDPGDGIGDGTEGEGRPAVSPDLAAEVDAAMADLASRLPDDTLIGVIAAHELTWPDGSLGCPEPGMAYTQALVPGYRIELTAGTDVYQYHGATGQDPFRCETP